MLRTDRVGQRERKRERERERREGTRGGPEKGLERHWRRKRAGSGQGRTKLSGPGSGDVRTLRTRSLIGDDLWRHSIFSLLRRKGITEINMPRCALPIFDSRRRTDVFTDRVRIGRTRVGPRDAFLAPHALQLTRSPPSPYFHRRILSKRCRIYRVLVLLPVTSG